MAEKYPTLISDSRQDTPRVPGWKDSFRTSMWISFFLEKEVRQSPSGGRSHKQEQSSRGTRHTLCGRDAEDNVKRVTLWDSRTPATHHLIHSSTWEGARKDSHLTEEPEAHRGEHIRTLLPRGVRAGRRDHREGTPTLSPISSWTVSAQAPGFFATTFLGNPSLQASIEEAHLQDRRPWFPLLS